MSSSAAAQSLAVCTVAGLMVATSTPSSHRRRQNRCSRLTPGPVTAGAQVRRASARITNGLVLCCLRPVFPSVATASRHEVSTEQVCCLRPVFPPVTHRAAGLGRLQVLRLLEPRVWPALLLSPTKLGRCRRHADLDTNILSGRSVR